MSFVRLFSVGIGLAYQVNSQASNGRINLDHVVVVSSCAAGLLLRPKDLK